MNPLAYIDEKLDALALKIERRITAALTRRLSRVLLLIAADNEDNESTKTKIAAALAALGS